MMQRVFYSLALFLMAILAWSCSGPQTTKTDSGTKQRIKVLATTQMVADLAINILGSHGDVEALMGPGIDPHLYKAKASDLAKMREADVILYNGLHLEGKLGEVLEKLSKEKPVVAVTNSLPREELISLGNEGLYDPHVWFDVALWAGAIPSLADTLSTFIKNPDACKTNAKVYKAYLDSLDAWARTRFSAIPQEKRLLVTAHDAFGYFGKAYGLEVKALQGISTLSDFGLKDVNELVEFIIERKVPMVFIETSVPEKNLKAVVEGCTARGHELRLGKPLYSDAMGDYDTPEGTYPGMVRHNVLSILEGME